MTQKTVRAVGLVWYAEEDWGELMQLFEDAHLLPPTYGKWREKAEQLFKHLKAQGFIAEKVYIRPQEFPDWCRSRGLNIDAKARNRYASWVVARKYGQTH